MGCNLRMFRWWHHLHFWLNNSKGNLNIADLMLNHLNFSSRLLKRNIACKWSLCGRCLILPLALSTEIIASTF